MGSLGQVDRLTGMEFFVFLNDEKTYAYEFRIGPDKFSTPFSEIVSKFLERLYSDAPDFPKLGPGEIRVFYDDISDPFVSHPEEITDLSKPVSSLPTRQFDLILSSHRPEASHFAFPFTSAIVDTQVTCNDLLLRAQAASKNHNYQSALYFLREAANMGADITRESRKLNLLILTYMERYKWALEWIQDNVLASNPGDSEGQFMLAKVHQKLGSHDKAIEMFKRCLVLPTDDFSIYDKVNVHIAKSLFAMGNYDQAAMLVQPIVNNNVTDLGARVLLGQIYAKQGKFAEALRLVLPGFTLQPDNKKCKRFLGEHIVNMKQVEFLRAELGDGVKDPNVLFYIGHILRDYGSCGAASWFMKEAVKLAPSSSTIFVGALLNFLALRPPPSEFFAFIQPGIKIAAGRSDELKDLFAGFDPTSIVSDFDITEKKEIASDLSSLAEGTEECQWPIEKLDMLWMAVIILNYMFTNGFVTACEPLIRNLKPHLEKYSFNSTVLKEEIEVCRHVISLVPLIERPLPKHDQILILGEANILSFAWQTIAFQEKPYLIRPIYFRSGRATDIVSKHGNETQTKYRIESERIQENSLVILCFAKIDYRDELSVIADSDEWSALGIVQVAKHLATTKHCKVWVHPVIQTQFSTNDSFTQIMQINLRLAFRVWSVNQTMPDIRMVDVSDDLTEKDEQGQPRWKPEFVRDGVRLLPACLPILENALNSTGSRLAEYRAKCQLKA